MNFMIEVDAKRDENTERSTKLCSVFILCCFISEQMVVEKLHFVC